MSYCYGSPIETTVQTSDQLSLYSTVQGQPRRASVSALADAVELLHPTPEGVLDISSFYVMRGTTTSVVALTTTPAPFNATQYSSPSFTLRTNASSLTFDAANGRMVATRDIEAVEFTCSVSGTWPTNRDLTLAVEVGTPGSMFTSSFSAITSGGGANPRTVSISGPVSNLNDSQGIIRAGQVIRLVASFNTADNLTLTRIAFAVRTLDGK